MPVLPFIPAIAAVAGAGASIYGANKAAGAAGDAAEQNNALQKYIYDQNSGNLTPFMNYGKTGGNALQALLGLGGDPGAAQKAFGDYQNSTGYQFRLGEGMNGLNTRLDNMHLTNSGAAVKAGVKYNQDFASNEFGNYLDRLYGQQQVGLSGANALAGVGTNYANAVSANNNNAADARGNAWLYGTNAFSNGIGAVGKAWPSGGYGG